MEAMSEDRLQDIERLYVLFNRREIEAVLARLTEDVHWANGMEGGYVDGRDAVREYWLRQFDMIDGCVEPSPTSSPSRMDRSQGSISNVSRGRASRRPL
jgi:ketosteroid isomerase-like protein